MNRSFNKDKFNNVIKAVSIILRLSVIFLYVLLGFLFIAAVIFAFLPKDILDFDLANLENLNVQFTNIMYILRDGSFIGIINLKWLLVLLFFTISVNVLFIQLILLKLRKIVSDVKEENPFSVKNIHRLKFISIAYFVSSFVLPTVNGWLFTVGANTFKIFDATFNFSLNFSAIFMGVILLILAYVFDYGASLQEDYDLTV